MPRAKARGISSYRILKDLFIELVHKISGIRTAVNIVLIENNYFELRLVYVSQNQIQHIDIKLMTDLYSLLRAEACRYDT
jgi:hypothetical protein